MRYVDEQIINLFRDDTYTPMRVPESGTSKEFIKLDAAITSGVSFMVMPKNHLFIIDSDTLQESRCYQEYREFLVSKKVSHFEWNSGREGHRHLVAAFQTVELQTEAWHLIKRLGLDLRFHRMTRPPLAPHRLGFKVSLVDGYIFEDIEKTLKVTRNQIFDPPTKNAPVIKKQPRYLTRQLEHMIKDGAPPASDRSFYIQSVALALANAGYDIDDGAKVLSNPKNKISLHIIDSRKYPTQQFQYAQTFMRKAHNYKTKNPPISATDKAKSARSRLEKLLLFIEQRPWTGRTASTDLSNLKAHLLTAIRVGSYNYNMSIREQELEAESAVKTCQKSNKRLVDTGWLVKRKSHNKDLSVSWRITLPTDLVQDYHTFLVANMHEGVVVSHMVSLKGVFRPFLKGMRGLGKSTGRVYAQINAGKRSIADITKASGMSRWTVKRALERLKAVAMLNDNLEINDPPQIIIEAAEQKLQEIRKRQDQERLTWQERRLNAEIGRMRKAS